MDSGWCTGEVTSHVEPRLGSIPRRRLRRPGHDAPASGPRLRDDWKRRSRGSISTIGTTFFKEKVIQKELLGTPSAPDRKPGQDQPQRAAGPRTAGLPGRGVRPDDVAGLGGGPVR